MNTKEKDLQKVLELQHGQSCYVAWSEEGGGEVYRIWDKLFLFEIPTYGGEGRLSKVYDENDHEDLVNEARSWT